MQQSRNSPDPKGFVRENFKKDMKKFGINNDMKKLKNFKMCLQSRSQETLTHPDQKKGDEIPPDEEEEPNGDFDTLYQNQS